MEVSKLLGSNQTEKIICGEMHCAKTCLAKSIEWDSSNIQAYKKL
jgi:hypothetical protein